MADTDGMAKGSTRALWKGAITFGLVPVAKAKKAPAKKSASATRRRAA